MALSKTAIDKLGDRLRVGNVLEDDLRLLDDYRRSFAHAYEVVIGTLRSQLDLQPTGRPAKSTTSIVEKLRRETARLTQIQDIAGCRIVVTDIHVQTAALADLLNSFRETHTRVVDRRRAPSHGYRAVHVIVQIDARHVEIQLRSDVQHLWAELSEALADYAGQEVKYGGGPPDVRDPLREASKTIEDLENVEDGLPEMKLAAATLYGAEAKERIEKLESSVITMRAAVQERVETAIMSVKDERRFNRDFLD